VKLFWESRVGQRLGDLYGCDLYHAVQSGHVRVVMYLLLHLSSPNFFHPETMKTALFVAAEKRFFDLMKRILAFAQEPVNLDWPCHTQNDGWHTVSSFLFERWMSTGDIGDKDMFRILMDYRDDPFTVRCRLRGELLASEGGSGSKRPRDAS
jgi:hypothetical protein